MYSALHPEKVKNLVTLVAPVDFDTDKGILNLWQKAWMLTGSWITME